MFMLSMPGLVPGMILSIKTGEMAAFCASKKAKDGDIVNNSNSVVDIARRRKTLFMCEKTVGF